MAKTSLDPLRFFKGNYDHQSNYVKNCKDEYCTQICITGQGPVYYFTVHHLEILHLRYEYGVRKGWLALSYPEFESAIKGTNEPAKRAWEYTSYRYSRYHVGTKYRKNTEHKPKEESAKAVWREYKKFSKDKNQYAHWGTCSRARQFAKRLQNVRRRRRDRQLLAKCDYEAFINPKVDRWLWC